MLFGRYFVPSSVIMSKYLNSMIFMCHKVGLKKSILKLESKCRKHQDQIHNVVQNKIGLGWYLFNLGASDRPQLVTFFHDIICLTLIANSWYFYSDIFVNVTYLCGIRRVPILLFCSVTARWCALNVMLPYLQYNLRFHLWSAIALLS